MNGAVQLTPRPISIIVTTHGTDTLYTQACLESIGRWKNTHHELIVVTHDESPLLRAYLDACAADGLIDKLIFAVPGHGHTRSFNLGVRYATADVIFHIANDILIGPSLVDDCAHKLRHNPQLGLIGWHWYNEGTFWRGDKIVEYKLRDENNPLIPPQDQENIRNAPWFTGKAFKGLGDPQWLCLCNTGFFGIRRDVLEEIGGGFGKEYPHYWADDFLNYAVLDQGLDIHHFEKKFRDRAFFHEFQYDNTDVEDRQRHADILKHDKAFLDSIRLLGGGMSEEESVFLHLLASAVPDGSTVTNVGLWRGSSAIVLLDVLKSKRIAFYFIDCFDLPGISAMSGQPPVGREEFLKYIEPYVAAHHTVNVQRANTLERDRFPESDFVFLDAGHTKKCVAHDARLVRACLSPRGVAVFHDYGYPDWPDVKPEIDTVFPAVQVYKTMAVYRSADVEREEYKWPNNPGGVQRTLVGNRGSQHRATNPQRLILRSFQSPGDIVLLTAAVRDLHRAFPDQFVTDVRTTAPEIWENNPYVTSLDENDADVRTIEMHYPLIHQSNTAPYHFIHGYVQYLETQLGIRIPLMEFKGDIYLSEQEQEWVSQLEETGFAGSFWIIVAGGKYDFTAKWWNPASYQKVVDHFQGRIQFVQCGEAGHWHPPLKGVINFVGKTDTRQFIRLMYHADGVVCPVTLAMHLAAAVETKTGKPKNRACVVVAGGREPSQWEAYPHHRFHSTNGALDCCDNGGCWKSRCQPVGDGDSKDGDLCVYPVEVSSDLHIPKCLHMIAPEDVIRNIEMYYEGGALRYNEVPAVVRQA